MLWIWIDAGLIGRAARSIDEVERRGSGAGERKLRRLNGLQGLKAQASSVKRQVDEGPDRVQLTAATNKRRHTTVALPQSEPSLSPLSHPTAAIVLYVYHVHTQQHIPVCCMSHP
ncbi:hypothetical protein NX059_006068 [Plenodomus lindquistii]|nr:hypothetical protein NX059_006068 [Plenodomus lindquistii]